MEILDKKGFREVNKRIGELLNAEPGTPGYEELKTLSEAVLKYEKPSYNKALTSISKEDIKDFLKDQWTINVNLEKSNTGYSAYSSDLNGVCASIGKSVSETKENFLEALKLHLNGLKEDLDLNLNLHIDKFHLVYKEI